MDHGSSGRHERALASERAVGSSDARGSSVGQVVGQATRISFTVVPLISDLLEEHALFELFRVHMLFEPKGFGNLHLELYISIPSTLALDLLTLMVFPTNPKTPSPVALIISASSSAR
jgi:hypothetical protein